MNTLSLLSSLDAVFAELSQSTAKTVPDVDEDCYALVERISIPGPIHEISKDAYQFFLESSPPKLLGWNRFCSANGDEPLRMFWTMGGSYYCRQLTRQETNRLCDASGLPREYGI